jgi:hypothetical protein
MITDARIALLVLLAIGVLAVIIWPRHAWRWHTGHTLNGRHLTNATWTRPATRVLHPTGNAVRWHKMPRLQRAGIRTGFTLAVLACMAAFLLYPWPSLIALAVLGAAGVLYAGGKGYRKVRRWWPS